MSTPQKRYFEQFFDIKVEDVYNPDTKEVYGKIIKIDGAIMTPNEAEEFATAIKEAVWEARVR